MRFVVCGIWSAVLLISLVCCSLSRGQDLNFKVEGPTTKPQGELVTLIVMFPEGVKADVDFTPIDEPDFNVDPIISEDATGVIKLVGRKCSFSTRCAGPRTINVVASAFAIVGDGVPRLRSIKHSVTVTGPTGTPPVGPPPAPGDDVFIPVPAVEGLPAVQAQPQAALSQEDDERLARIFDNILNRLDADAEVARQTNERFLTRLEELDAGFADIESQLRDILNKNPPTATKPPAKTTTAAPVPAPAPQPTAAQIACANRKPGEVWVTKVCGVPVEPYRESVGPGQQSSLPVIVPCKVGVLPALPTGGRWNIEGNWNPSYRDTLNHLRESKHSHFSAQYEPLERFNHGQLRWIHDQHHDELSGRAPVQYSAPVRTARQQAVGSACPGGVCPTGVGAYRSGGGIFGGFFRGR